jgi:hypothetical protein
MMTPPTKSAVDWAQFVLDHGHNPLVRQIAEEILVSQTVEIGARLGCQALLRHRPNPGSCAAVEAMQGPAARAPVRELAVKGVPGPESRQ